jgi:hypothetical protein
MRSPLKTVGAVMIGFGCVAILGTGTARAEILDAAQLATEMRHSAILREEIRHAGYPDLVQRLDAPTAWPWKPSIIRLFYLEPRREIAVSRAYLLDVPQLSFVRYRRPMSDELADEVSHYLATTPAPLGETGPAERAELAARRAESAAARAESGAVTAEHAAQRLESVATKMEGSLEERLRKK